MSRKETLVKAVQRHAFQLTRVPNGLKSNFMKSVFPECPERGQDRWFSDYLGHWQQLKEDLAWRAAVRAQRIIDSLEYPGIRQDAVPSLRRVEWAIERMLAKGSDYTAICASRTLSALSGVPRRTVSRDIQTLVALGRYSVQHDGNKHHAYRITALDTVSNTEVDKIRLSVPIHRLSEEKASDLAVQIIDDLRESLGIEISSLSFQINRVLIEAERLIWNSWKPEPTPEQPLPRMRRGRIESYTLC